MDTLENLHRKIEGAGELKSIVRTMKALAAANIGQYETAVGSLGDYFHTVELGIFAYFSQEKINLTTEGENLRSDNDKTTCGIVFGSDQGLVGQFNDSLADFVSNSLEPLPGKHEIWAIGERVQLLLSDSDFNTTKLFSVPNSVKAITQLVGKILIEGEENLKNENIDEFYIFHNQPHSRSGYEPVSQRFLPFDKKWIDEFTELRWTTKQLPDIVGSVQPTLAALISEYLFVSLFKACAESLAAENGSRLNAMQRAEKNIEEMLDNLNHDYHSLRQSSIDEELFDIVAGFEALK